MTLDDRPVALQRSGAWILDADRKGWRKSEWSKTDDASAIRGVASDGRQAFVLTSGEQTDYVARAARLIFADDVLTTHALAPLPTALSHAVGVVRDETLYLAGIDAAGAPQLLQLFLSGDTSRWATQGGWPGGGRPTSIVAQNSAIYLTVHDEGRPSDRMLRWSAPAGWQQRPDAPAAIVAGSARAIGQAQKLECEHSGNRFYSLARVHRLRPTARTPCA